MKKRLRSGGGKTAGMTTFNLFPEVSKYAIIQVRNHHILTICICRDIEWIVSETEVGWHRKVCMGIVQVIFLV